MERRIAAILAADMAGFSRLVELDEAGVVARQKRHFAELIRPQIETANGRIVKLTGDGLIAEFPSVVDAVGCAVLIQKEMAAREADQPEDRRIRYRIAVNLGDVIFDEDEVYGDGVNIAARLEALAEPGGVVVSGEAYDHLKAKVDVGYKALGEKRLKNIATPVRVFQVVELGAIPQPLLGQSRNKFVIAAAVVALIAAGGGWWLAQRPDVTPIDAARLKYDLPNKPSIAVTPFASLDADGGRNVLADGLTIDIITKLSRSKNLMVIASHSMRTYTDQSVNATEIAEELGVRYVLEGGLQQSSDDLMINVRLIDALTGQILWAETHEGGVGTFFEIQEAISARVAGTVAGEYGIVARADLNRARQKPPTDLTAYELTLLAADIRDQNSKENNRKSFELLTKAIESDPTYARAHIGLAWTHLQDVFNHWVEDLDASKQLALASGQRAVQLDPASAQAHYALGSIQTWLLGQIEEGGASMERAREIEPNNPDMLVIYGSSLADQGRADEGAKIAMSALRLNPHHPDWYFETVQWPLAAAGRDQEAIEVFKSAKYPGRSGKLLFISSLVKTGEIDEARKFAAEFLDEYPDFSIAEESTSASWTIPNLQEFKDQMMRRLGEAGLPEFSVGAEPAPDAAAPPRIAVLPFENVGGDGWLADGLTVDVTTRLSYFDDLRVIARTSTLQYKGKAIDVRQIGEELGADYILEGSVRQSGDAFRVTAQLIDTESAVHIWADDFSRSKKAVNIFAVQDEITGAIVAAIAGSTGEITQLARSSVMLDKDVSLEGYKCVILGISAVRTFNREEHQRATECLEKTVEATPGYSYAWAWLAWTRHYEVAAGLNPQPNAAERSLEAALMATKTGPKSAVAFAALPGAWFMNHDRERAIQSAEMAISLNPHNTEVTGLMGIYKMHVGEFESGKELIEKAFALTPYPPEFFYMGRFHYHYYKGEYEVAYHAVQELVSQPDVYWQHLLGSIALVELGRIEEANALIERARKIEPNVDAIVPFVHDIWWWALPDKGEGYVEALKTAGLKLQ